MSSFFVQPPGLFRSYYRELVWRKNEEKTVCLTFDDGPTPGVTDFVLDLLKENKIKATFFCIGKNALAYPQLLTRIKEEGHRLGNHTQNHLNGWETTSAKYESDVEACAGVFESKIFRPPYGRIRKSQILRLKKKYEIIMWDVLSMDFDPRTSPEQCLENVKKYTRGGSIIVFHDSAKAEKNLRYALPPAIDYLSGKDFVFDSI
jgi:peptidoglycan-N-acetylglucosamine deacetylase